jgi:hypothetical protein
MTTTRRALLRTGAAGAGAVAVAPVVSAPADAAVSYRPGRYRATRVPSRATLHVLERFTYGYNPSLRRQVERAGGLTPWFEGQLRPRRDRFFTDSSEWWPAINASHTTIVSRDKSGAQGLSQANADYQRWAMVRRVHSSADRRRPGAQPSGRSCTTARWAGSRTCCTPPRRTPPWAPT